MAKVSFIFEKNDDEYLAVAHSVEEGKLAEYRMIQQFESFLKVLGYMRGKTLVVTSGDVAESERTNDKTR